MFQQIKIITGLYHISILTSINQLLSIPNWTTCTTMVGILAINLTISEI